MKIFIIINLVFISLTACSSYLETKEQKNIINKASENTFNEDINNNKVKFKIVENNCIATMIKDNEIISEVYLAGSKQEEYFLPCVKSNYIYREAMPTTTKYIFSLDQVAPDNRYFTIARILEIKNDRFVDDVGSSNLINGCFVENPVTDIQSIEELLLNMELLKKQCDADTQRLKLNKDLSLYDQKLNKTNVILSKNNNFYIIDNKRAQGLTWYQIDNGSSDNLWLSCKDINLC